ncbi:hypothetical protein LJY25_02460 [Hymenobacter sp. BT175]|uniref:hypothetical protein n=1 Tax=Hymenobacter translucens TaxID=2886507 RepID=UPI001D0DF220|nr:hypothetical protein [Hymenobacter translucens]MCC2545293.1 hypothetical protein [Hymenobacter translucens]
MKLLIAQTSPAPRPIRPGQRRMLAVATALALLTATAGWASIRSNLFIEPRKQFVLGGKQPGAFKVAAHNVGKVAVEFRERPKGGGIFGKATLAPGQQATLRFAAGSAAVVLNPSAETANLQLRITGDTQQLRMDYEENGKK